MPLRAEIRFRAKTIVTSLSRDSYWDPPQKKYHNKVQSIRNTCVIMFLTIKINSVKYKKFRNGRCTYKNTGSSHLKLLTLSSSLLTLKQFFVPVYGYIFSFENNMRREIQSLFFQFPHHVIGLLSMVNRQLLGQRLNY